MSPSQSRTSVPVGERSASRNRAADDQSSGIEARPFGATIDAGGVPASARDSHPTSAVAVTGAGPSVAMPSENTRRPSRTPSRRLSSSDTTRMWARAWPADSRRNQRPWPGASISTTSASVAKRAGTEPISASTSRGSPSHSTSVTGCAVAQSRVTSPTSRPKGSTNAAPDGTSIAGNSTVRPGSPTRKTASPWAGRTSVGWWLTTNRKPRSPSERTLQRREVTSGWVGVSAGMAAGMAASPLPHRSRNRCWRRSRNQVSRGTPSRVREAPKS